MATSFKIGDKVEYLGGGKFGWPQQGCKYIITRLRNNNLELQDPVTNVINTSCFYPSHLFIIVKQYQTHTLTASKQMNHYSDISYAKKVDALMERSHNSCTCGANTINSPIHSDWCDFK